MIAQVMFEKRTSELVAIRLTKEGLERQQRVARSGCCTSCEGPFAPGEKVKRGMHVRCYSAFVRARDAGKVTEQEFIKRGKMTEKPKRGRPASNPTTIAIAEGD